jgi:membrane fusion protein, multidrug efflux system
MRYTYTPVGANAVKARARSLSGLALMLLALTSAGCTSATGASGTSEGPSVLVQTIRVQEGSLPRIVRAYGSAQANSADRDSVTVTLPATVESVYVRVGEDVSKGAALLRLAPTPQSESSYAQAVSALHVASELVRRTTELYQQHLATRQQLSSAEKGRTDARSALEALEAQGAAGPTTVRAPFSGIVTTISTSAHAIASVGSVLLELVRPDALVLNVGVAPSEASQIKPGDRVSVRAVGAQQSVSSSVTMRGAVVDATTGLVPVQISLPAGALLPGQWAEARITVGQAHGYVVPHEAVLVDDDGGTYVVQVHHGLAKIVHVRVLAALGARDTVSGAIDGLAPLVLSGNYQLSDGMRIRLADSSDAQAKGSK